jgi:ferritin-like metal-binding protein YciE
MAIDNTESGSLYLTGLRNAHALEGEALQIMGRQVERLEHYPEMRARLLQHIDETEGQQQRLMSILESHGTDSSTFKDALQALMGNVAAIGHSMAGDEILKNSFANYAFESFEIAAYKSLIAMAERVGDRSAVDALRQNLEEEVAMQEWLETQIEPTTLRFLSLAEQGQRAKI